jgi:predicted transcriptional regulator
MLRTTVYLDEDVSLSVRKLANLSGRPQAELIREAVREYVTKLETESTHKVAPGVGAYRSGRSDVSNRVDDILKKAARARK